MLIVPEVAASIWVKHDRTVVSTRTLAEVENGLPSFFGSKGDRTVNTDPRKVIKNVVTEDARI